MGLLDDTVGQELNARRKQKDQERLIEMAMAFIRNQPGGIAGLISTLQAAGLGAQAAAIPGAEQAAVAGDSAAPANDTNTDALKALAGRLPEIMALLGKSAAANGSAQPAPLNQDLAAFAQLAKLMLR